MLNREGTPVFLRDIKQKGDPTVFYCCYGFMGVCVSVFKDSEHYLEKYTPNCLSVSGGNYQ